MPLIYVIYDFGFMMHLVQVSPCIGAVCCSFSNLFNNASDMRGVFSFSNVKINYLVASTKSHRIGASHEVFLYSYNYGVIFGLSSTILNPHSMTWQEAGLILILQVA